MTTLPDLLTEDQAADALTRAGIEVTASTLRSWRGKGRIAHPKIGGRVRYTERMLREFIEASAYPARAAARDIGLTSIPTDRTAPGTLPGAKGVKPGTNQRARETMKRLSAS